MVGEVIAVGIFLTPADLVKSLGSPVWLFVVWLAMGGMALCGALCFGELGARYPEAGGCYVYLREAYGRRVAFLYGWMSLLVMDPGLTAALGVGMAGYAGYVLGLSPIGIKAVAIAAILILAAINIRGVSFSACLIRWLAILKLALIGFIILWGFSFQRGSWSNFFPLVPRRPGSAPLIVGLAGGIVAAFFSFGGWWDVNKLAGELRDPKHTLPRALCYGIIIVTLVYILTSAAFIYLVPFEQVTSGEIFAAQAGEVLFGRKGAEIFSIIVIVAIFGSIAAFLMSAPRVYFAMARDGLFISAAASIHPEFETPAYAIAIQAALASLLVVLGNFKEIVAYFVFIAVIFIALTVAALFVLRRKNAKGVTYVTPGYPLTPIMFLLPTAILLILLGGNNPMQALAGVAVVLSGLPVYHFAFRERRSLKNTQRDIECAKTHICIRSF